MRTLENQTYFESYLILTSVFNIWCTSWQRVWFVSYSPPIEFWLHENNPLTGGQNMTSITVNSNIMQLRNNPFNMKQPFKSNATC